MANSFGSDILIQAPDPKKTAHFYVMHLVPHEEGFVVFRRETQIATKRSDRSDTEPSTPREPKSQGSAAIATTPRKRSLVGFN
jgi:hypothetical protein